MPGAGALEVGAASQSVEKWSVEFRVLRAFDMDGGHLSTTGIDDMGDQVMVPEYRHRVQMDLLRLQFTARRRLSESWTAWLRLPYDVKERTASIEPPEGVDPADEEAMQRNMQIHHPTATLSGFADASLLAAHRADGIFSDSDVLILAAGSSIPLGRTEHDPFTLGAEGLAHEHVQFGTGTFDPMLEAYYVRPLSGDLGLSAYATGRFPLYENDKQFSPPIQLTTGALLNWRAREGLQVHVGLNLFRQQSAEWNGVRDPDAGVESIEFLAGANWSIGGSSHLTLGLVVPLSQRPLEEDAERFERGIALTIGISAGIGTRADE